MSPCCCNGVNALYMACSSFVVIALLNDVMLIMRWTMKGSYQKGKNKQRLHQLTDI